MKTYRHIAEFFTRLTRKRRRRGSRAIPQNESPTSSRAGFTLPEIMVGSTVMLMVLGGTFLTFFAYQRTWRGSEAWMAADREANAILHRVVYGIDGQQGLRSAAANTIQVSTNANGWILSFAIGTTGSSLSNSIAYRATEGDLLFLPSGRTVGDNLDHASVALRSNITIPHAPPRLTDADFSIGVTRQQGLFRATRNLNTIVRFRN